MEEKKRITSSKDTIKSDSTNNLSTENISDEELSLDDGEKENHSQQKNTLAPWKMNLLKIANKPMTLIDNILSFFGGAFEPIFCGIIPFGVIFLIFYCITNGQSTGATISSYVAMVVLICLLMFLPKVASAVEFLTIGVYLGILKSGLLLAVDPALAHQIDSSGNFTAGITSGGILGIASVAGAVVLLLGKLIFFTYLKLKVYRRKYFKRKHTRSKEKKHVAQLDSNSDVLM